MALVSVYIPTKNRLQLLQRAVGSVMNQTYRDIELVISDDGSTDGTRAYLADLSQSGKARVLMSPVSFGACAARNQAILAATGKFVTGLDDDDYFAPTRIERMVKAWDAAQARGEAIGGVFDSVREIRPTGSTVRRNEARVSSLDVRYRGAVGNQLFSLKENYIGAGLFDPAMPVWQDWDMWARIATKYGDLVGLQSETYILDAAHDYDRITRKQAFLVRHGFMLFAHKHGPYSARQKASLIAALASYPQVTLTLSELATMLFGGKSQDLGKYILRKTMGESRYDSFKFRYLDRKVRDQSDLALTP